MSAAREIEAHRSYTPVGFYVSAWIPLLVGTGDFTVDAFYHLRVNGSFTASALRLRTIEGSTKLDALVVERGFTVNAITRPWVDPEVFTVDARKCGGGSFTTGAWLAKTMRLDPIVLGVGSGSTKLDALIYPTYMSGYYYRTIDALIKATRASSLKTDAWILQPVTTGDGSRTVDAWIAGPYEWTFTLDAAVVLRPTHAFTVSSDIRSQNEVRGTASIDSMIGQRTDDLFDVLAVIGPRRFTANARLGRPPGAFTANATFALFRPGGSFVIDARIAGHFHVDAVMVDSGATARHFHADAYIFLLHNAFYIDAVKGRRRPNRSYPP